MNELIVLAVWLFVITHIDTYLVLVAFCTDHSYEHWEVFIGHVFGFTVGLSLALVGSIIAAGLLQGYSFLLGVLPLALGVWGLLDRSPVDTPVDQLAVHSTATRITAVTTAGIGLSGENIAVFVPFFLTLGLIELVVVFGGYLIGALVLFVVAVLSARMVEGRPLPRWIDDWLVPVLLIAVGLYVLVMGWYAVDVVVSPT